jgi:ATP-dependent DNA helicase 2 subunit 1
MQAWNEAISEDPRAVETLKGGTKRTTHKVEVDEADLEDIEGAWRNGSISKVRPQ